MNPNEELAKRITREIDIEMGNRDLTLRNEDREAIEQLILAELQRGVEQPASAPQCPMCGEKRKIKMDFMVNEAVCIECTYSSPTAGFFPSTAPGLSRELRQELTDEACGEIWLHGNDKWLTEKMRTPAKEAFADAVDRHFGKIESEHSPIKRWWRDDMVR